MGRKRERRRRPADLASGPTRRLSRYSFVLPVLVVVLLCIPCLWLGYFWDDYYFLTSRGRGGIQTYLLPEPEAAFYRPISQGLYFLFLRFADPTAGLLGHVLNLATLAGAVTLLVLLVSRLCGKRAGLISGLVFASLGCVPSLVAWVSCSQDLLAIGFVLAAFLLRDQGKAGLALACATAAVFCKEPAIAAFPVLVLWDRLVGRPTARLRFHVFGYGAVSLMWLSLHPGIHRLAQRGFHSGATGYVGIEHPERWGRYLVRYVETLVNLRPLGLTGSWWESRVPFGLAALVVLVGGLLILDRGLSRERAARALPVGRVALVAALFGAPTLMMPVVLIRHWAPYFACIPAAGLAVVAGPLLARQRTAVVAIVLAVFLLLGLRYRGYYAQEEAVWSERLFEDVAGTVRAVRANLHTMFPSFPKGSEVLVSVESTGRAGVRRTLIDWQALRVWYRDPTLQTLDVLRRKPGAASEYLARITSYLDVIVIDPDARRLRASRPEAINVAEVGRPLRNYARAVAAAGDADRAVRVMQWFVGLQFGPGRVYGQRLIAMILLNAGRRAEAAHLLATTPAFPRETSLSLLKRLLAEPSESEHLDNAAFEAFGLSETDPETIRWVMREFLHDGAIAQAAWFAQRLQKLAPGDAEGGAVLRSAERQGIEPRRVPA